MLQPEGVPRLGEVIVPLEKTVGRALDVERVSARLSQARLCCITGPLGVGKSHLAQEAAWALAPHFSGGVFWCDASAATSVEDLTALVEAMAIPLAPVLLVVDGTDGCAQAVRDVLPSWLGQHPLRKALVTSRERTAISGEVVVPLDPLTPADAAALFIQRARSLDDRFAPTEQEHRAIDEIVRWVDGLPLAVSLCAAQTLVLRPAALLQHLRNADARLDASAKGGSLRQTIHSAFALLPEDAKQVLVACSIFAGPFTFDAAAAVARASLASLTALCERSFIRAGDERGARRFRLYRPIQDFASGVGVDTPLRERHLRWYLQRLQQPDDVDETRRNLLACAAYDAERDAKPRALETLVAVTPLVLRLGPVAHALALFERVWPADPSAEALYAAGRLRLLDGQFNVAAALLDAAQAQLGQGDPLAPAILLERANAARVLGKVDDATRLYNQALTHPGVERGVTARTLERLAGHLFGLS